MDLAEIQAINSAASTISQNAMNMSAMVDNKDIMREQRKWTSDFYHEQLADARENWRMQNEYNSPTAQMKRLEEAGLNPNLVYGNGATATSNSAPSTPSAGSYTPYYKPMNAISGMGNIFDALNGAMDLKMKESQIDNTEAHTRLTNFDADLRTLQNINQAIKNTSDSVELDYLKRMKESFLSNQMAHTNNLESQTNINNENFGYLERYGELEHQYGLSKTISDIHNTKEKTISEIALRQGKLDLLGAQISDVLKSINLKDSEISKIMSEIRKIDAQQRGQSLENRLKRVLVDRGLNLNKGLLERFLYAGQEYVGEFSGATGSW